MEEAKAQVKATLQAGNPSMTEGRAQERADDRIRQAVAVARDEAHLRKEVNAKIAGDPDKDLEHLTYFFTTVGVSGETARAIAKEVMEGIGV